MTVSWDPHFYKTGYEGFERLENFPTPAALDEYRRLLLKKTRVQVAFIVRHLGNRKLRVIEFGSGNGRLLIAMALEGILETGLGVEVSQSRVRFAQQWAADSGLDGVVRSVAADALEFRDDAFGAFDLAVCITGTFGYFKPIRDDAPAVLLDRMRSALGPDGHLLLELYQMPDKRRQMLALSDGKLRTWQPLPPEDRFAYYLDDLEYESHRHILRHGKVFIGRDGVIDAGRVEVLAYYTDSELTDLLRQNRLKVRLVYTGFDDAPYYEGQSSSMVVLAQKSIEKS